MTTLVYPVGHGRGDLLRYSLRSVASAAGAAVPDIVLVGECPDYINRDTVTFLPSSQAFGPFVNVWVAWQRTAAHLGVEAEWWWMNDDFFITAESLDDALIDAHRGPLDAFCASLDGKPGVGPWRRRARATGSLLAVHGYASPSSWEAHRPMRATGHDVSLAGAMLRRYGMKGADVAQRTLIATVGGREGVHLADPKTDERGDGPWWFDQLVSTGPRAWAGPIGAGIRARFPTPSQWERV